MSTCPACGSELDWEDCYTGCDEGFVDEYDEDPINCSPGEMRPCNECMGTGGRLFCPACRDKANRATEGRPK